MKTEKKNPMIQILENLWDRNSNQLPLKQLAEKVEENRYKERPSVPIKYRIKPVFRENTANELTRSIIEFMKVIGGQAERINSMGRQITKNRRTIWVYGTGTNGTADISATWEGKSIKIEVKATRGEKQSEKQKEYQRTIEQSGGIYIIARSFDGFLFQFFKAVEGFNHGD